MRHPLEGIRAIEMGAYGPATVAGQWLGDLGADVIMVDPPSNRFLDDPEVGREPRRRAGGRSVTSRNKRSIVINLTTDEGKQVLHDLVKDVDVFLEANRPGVLPRLDAGYERLSSINPRLIYCSVTGYGQEGPYRMLPGHGITWEGSGGWIRAIGMEYGNMGGDYTGKPYLNPVNIADLRTGLHVVIAIEAALYAREKTGEGQYLDMCMVDAVTVVRSPRAQARGIGAYDEPRGPWWNAYECRDGRYVCVAAIEAIQWANLCRSLSRPDLIKDRGATGQRAAEVTATLAGIFIAKTRDEWFELLKDTDTELSKANTIDEAANDPQIKLRGMHVEVIGADGHREIQYGTPVKLSKTPPRQTHRAAPEKGQNTDELLAELGYDRERITQLRQLGAVR